MNILERDQHAGQNARGSAVGAATTRPMHEFTSLAPSARVMRFLNSGERTVMGEAAIFLGPVVYHARARGHVLGQAGVHGVAHHVVGALQAVPNLLFGTALLLNFVGQYGLEKRFAVDEQCACQLLKSVKSKDMGGVGK